MGDGCDLNLDDVAARLADLHGGTSALAGVVALGEAAIPAIESVLRGPPSSIYQHRVLAADALAIIGGPLAWAALARAFAESIERQIDPVLREAERAVIDRMAEHLARSGDASANDLLLEGLSRTASPGCARGLGHLRDPRAVPLLLNCLYDDVARGAAFDALQRFGDEIVPGLVDVLLVPRRVHGVEGASRVAGRVAAARLLAGRPGSEADAALWAALRDGEPDVRLASAIAMAHRRRDHPEVRRALLGGLESPDLAVSEEVVGALKQ